ncbi:MAG TPA: SDR family NAD(P)-dependent oxidoreductase [Polyangiaceae bacterium]|jgi:NAD(P)-dependent dehydrogenase (short-subunit alcohol dehydrogenase family)|nr:SDR family NAD(P)-dependent oxidoreductase [Polyangiaceae bacterium]
MTPIERQTVVVTGATDGLGKGVALELARRGATVIVHGRDPGRIAQTVDEVQRASRGGAVRSVQADFASLGQVRAMAAGLLANEARIDALVNNAGIGTAVPPGGRAESADGVELRFAVNYLAPYLLTRLLLPRLRESAPARVVNVSSAGQRAIDFDDVMLEKAYDGVRAYCQSKLAQVLFTIDLADELRVSGVTVNALHPATFMPTKIVPSPVSTLEEGVAATVRLVADPALDGVSGQYFNVQREARANAQAYDKVARQKLRSLSAKLTGVGE